MSTHIVLNDLARVMIGNRTHEHNNMMNTLPTKWMGRVNIGDGMTEEKLRSHTRSQHGGQ